MRPFLVPSIFSASLIALLLAGCTTTTTTTADPTAPAASATPSEPVTTPTPTPTPTPARPALSDLVLTPDGFGPLSVGSMILDQPKATAVVTWDPTRCAPDAGSDFAGAWIPNYPTAAWVNGEKVAPFSFASMKKTTPFGFAAIWSPQLTTAEGIGVGSSVAELKAAYPRFDVVKHNPTTDLYVIHGERGQLVFDVATKYQSGLTAWDSSVVGSVVWIYIQKTGTSPTSIANSDVGGSCSA